MSNPPAISPQLRMQAEARLARLAAEAPAFGNVELSKLSRELQVYRIALDMQNQALAEAQATAQAMQQKYTDLYETSPVGYLTLTLTGEIVDCNPRAAGLLGQDRNQLRGRLLHDFVTPSSLPELRGFFQNAQIKTGALPAPSLTLEYKNRVAPLFVNLQARTVADASSGKLEIRASMMDVSALKAVTEDVVHSLFESSRFPDIGD